MANPSLQIGNSNWAIKEDDLLGYSTVGTNYLPKPMTMTRASAGTRVNSAGLVKTVELLGSELVDCGGFECASPYTDWAVTGSVTIGSGVATFVDDGTNPNSGIAQSVLPYNKTFKIVFDITRYVGGRIQITAGGGTYSVDISGGVGVYTTIIQSVSSTTFRIKRDGGYSGWDFDIDNVSVKEYTVNNLARVDYDGTASSLLVEPERTNTVIYSEDFSQYNLSGFVTPIESGYLAPDGTNSAYKVTGVIGSSSIYLPSISSMTATKSIYARTVSGTGTTRLLSYYGNTNNTFTLTEEWQRFELTGSIVTGGANFYAVDFRSLTTTLSELIIWGGQSEEASYATSYIPTDGGTVTRIQDQYEKTGISNLINSTEGVLFVEMAALSNDSTFRTISINNGTNETKVQIAYYTASQTVEALVKVSNVRTYDYSYVLTDITDINKLAIKYKQDDFAFWVNGTEVDTSVSGNVPTGLNVLSFDNGNSGSPLYAKVKQLQVYKTALTDSELETLTT